MRGTLLIAGDKRDGVENLLRSDRLATLATQSLIAEAELTPKPGLVDRRGSGAHNDLSLDLMRLSATVLQPFFAAMSSNSADKEVNTSLREQLAEIGRGAERAMFKATHGANTHKGAIWTLGLLVGAAARRVSQSAQEIATVAGAIARLPDRAQPQLITHGNLMRDRYRVAGGTRGGVEWLSARDPVWPSHTAQATSREIPEEICRLDALLSLMSQVDDTCVLYRGGSEGLSFVKSGAQTVLMAGGYGSFSGRRLVRELDRELIARGISPGGSADLLAATIFLDAVEHQQSEIGDRGSK